MYMSIKTLDYVIFSHQANLSKTTKHWDGFVSHCNLIQGMLNESHSIYVDYTKVLRYTIVDT